MRIGILYHNKKHLPLRKAIQAARLEFSQAAHTRGHAPEEVHLNPAQAPLDSCIDSLPILVDARVPVWHLRLCTKDQALVSQEVAL